jgi:hypothetical protein
MIAYRRTGWAISTEIPSSALNVLLNKVIDFAVEAILR